jgi:HAD superfamily hydrolase (TIGR01549 family)
VIRAILFDLGSTLWDDYPSELAYWELLSELLARRGIAASLEDIIARSAYSIHSYCPSLTRAIVWHYVDGNRQLYDELIEELIAHMLRRLASPDEFRRLNPLFPGVPDLLEALRRKYPLAIVSQNFAEAEQWMAYHSIDSYFTHVSLSGREQLYKPDPRIFVRTCEALRIDPQEAVMVGDRLDNDIWPANRLKMTSVRVLADPYRIQQPRYHCDVPDHTIDRIADLPLVLPD